jgi:hypothetical protein
VKGWVKRTAPSEGTQQYPFVRYAISYLKNAEEMAAYRVQIGAPTYLIAKLERGRPCKRRAPSPPKPMKCGCAG